MIDLLRFIEREIEIDIAREEERILRQRKNRESRFKNCELYFIDETAMLKVGDQIFLAKPESGERFDAEKGLLVCLLKAIGIRPSEYMEILNRAVFKKTKQEHNEIKCDKKGKCNCKSNK